MSSVNRGLNKPCTETRTHFCFPFSAFLEKFIPISLDNNNYIIKYLKSFSQSYLKVYKAQMKIKIKFKDKVPMEIYLNKKIDMHSIKKNRNNFL